LKRMEKGSLEMRDRISCSVKGCKLLPFLLPVGAALIIPGLLLLRFETRPRARNSRIFFGSLFIGFGLFLMAWTVGLFHRIGKGTLAPWDPTQRLVVAGPYAHTRNPMITGVLSVLLGEATLSGSPAILVWAILFFLINSLYFEISEEPGLMERFGDEYAAYHDNVPMWLPRLKPWRR
jgi:protein-S-isoprenylcysteine O-methyltransferase Ste14